MKRIFPAALLLLVLAACGNPRQGAQNDPEPPPVNRPDPPTNKPVDPPRVIEALLRVRYAAGDKLRTTRTLAARERTHSGTVVTEASEEALNAVELVDELGRPLTVRRMIRSSRTSFGTVGGTMTEQRGALEGCVLELKRPDAATRPTTRVVSGEVDIGGQTFLIDGFDGALLPEAAVREGDRWEVSGDDLAGLNALVEALGFKIEKNELGCRVETLTEPKAEIALDWRVTGSFNQQPAVMAFEGKLVFDRTAYLVSEFSLAGGRGAGEAREVTISITRVKER